MTTPPRPDVEAYGEHASFYPKVLPSQVRKVVSHDDLAGMAWEQGHRVLELVAYIRHLEEQRGVLLPWAHAGATYESIEQCGVLDGDPAEALARIDSGEFGEMQS